jgi:lysyl-tRNA synthetase class II
LTALKPKSPPALDDFPLSATTHSEVTQSKKIEVKSKEIEVRSKTLKTLPSLQHRAADLEGEYRGKRAEAKVRNELIQNAVAVCHPAVSNGQQRSEIFY